MDKDIIGYCSAIAQARRMLKMGIISMDDYEKIDHVLLEKYAEFIEPISGYGLDI